MPHNEAIAKQMSSQVLLLLINQTNNAKGIVTGKLYEYLAARRPILGIGPTNGEVGEILKSSQAGIMIDYIDAKKMKETILDYYQQYKNHSLTVPSNLVENFSRKNLTRDLANLLDSLCEK